MKNLAFVLIPFILLFGLTFGGVTLFANFIPSLPLLEVFLITLVGVGSVTVHYLFQNEAHKKTTDLMLTVLIFELLAFAAAVYAVAWYMDARTFSETWLYVVIVGLVLGTMLKILPYWNEIRNSRTA